MHCWCSNIPLGSTLILFVTLVAAAQNSQDNCTYALLTECSNNLNAYLGIDEPRPWEQPVSWRGKVEQLFELEAVEGLRKLCRCEKLYVYGLDDSERYRCQINDFIMLVKFL